MSTVCSDPRPFFIPNIQVPSSLLVRAANPATTYAWRSISTLGIPITLLRQYFPHSYSEHFETPFSTYVITEPTIMHSFPKRSFFFKATQGYKLVQTPSERSSSDDIRSSDVGLLEKEVEVLRRRSSFWRRYILILIVNSVIFVLYVLVLGAVVSHSRSQALKGPGLIVCKIESLFHEFQRGSYNTDEPV
jgi:hypothetical protein